MPHPTRQPQYLQYQESYESAYQEQLTGSASYSSQPYDAVHERELERIKHKTHQLRSQRDASSHESSVFDSVDSSKVSWNARQEQQAMLRQFYASPEPRTPASPLVYHPNHSQNNSYSATPNNATNSTASTSVLSADLRATPEHDDNDGENNNTEEGQNESKEEEPDVLPLHDLCAEGVSSDDLSWRDALSLLVTRPELAQNHTPQGWTALHIACMGPAPKFMIRGLLYANAYALTQPDRGGRLPLHLWCASPHCDDDILQLLVDEYPSALSCADAEGYIPLHLLLRNTAVECTSDIVRILLGWTLPETTEGSSDPKIQLRKEHHLQLDVAKLEAWRTRPRRPITNFNRSREMESQPNDVKLSLRQLAQLHELLPRDPWDNPAALSDPTGQVPLHQFVQRAIVLQQPLDVYHKAPPQTFKSSSTEDEDDEEEDLSEHIRPSVPHIVPTLRLLISAYPQGLVVRNDKGHTPLASVLSASSQTPSIEIVEYLLGTRLQIERLPSWALDLPLSTDSPASTPGPQKQLPLHVCAEEWTSEYEILRAVQEAYPASITAVDEKGRTPLHLAFQSYRKAPLNPRTVELLYSDTVAQIADDYGHKPVDRLIESQSIPRVAPMHSHVYQRLFRASRIDELTSLAALPPWMRQEACSAPQIQQLVVRALGHPVVTSFCFLDGLLLVALITVFRIQLREHFDTLNQPTAGTLENWYTYAVYATAAFRLVLQALLWILQGGIPWTHFWTWVNVLAMCATLVTSVFLNGDVEDELLLQLSTAATGLLWCSAIGYLSTWWYGMAVFSGSFLQISSSLVWPLAVAGALQVAASQMFYTLMQLDCDSAIPGISVCTARESYRFVYALARGESLLGGEEWSNETICMVTIFLLLCAVWIVAVLLNIVMSAMRLDADQVALKYFWEPQLATVLSFGLGTGKPENQLGLMARIWHILTFAQQDEWYQSSSSLQRFGVGIAGAIILPVWILAGAFTLGWLWPPQVRCWLFRPSKVRAPPVDSRDQLSELRRELLQVKLMSYEKSIDTERELLMLRQVLSSGRR